MTYEEAIADAYCPCHGVPWYVHPGGKSAGKRQCRVKKAEERVTYNSSEKGRASRTTYERSEKGRAQKARSNARTNARRVGTRAETYLGMAPTAEIARDLNQLAADFAALQKGRA